MESGQIYAAMNAIYKAVGTIGKDRRNAQQNFAFRGIDDVLNALHGIFADNGVFVVPERVGRSREAISSKTGTGGFNTISTIKFTFYAGDGSNVSAVVDGEGSDYGDKSTSKSQSMAMKYALIQMFMIPTEDIDDSDKTTPEAMKTQQEQELEAERIFANKLDSLKTSANIDSLKRGYEAMFSEYKHDPAKIKRLLEAKDARKKELEVA